MHSLLKSWTLPLGLAALLLGAAPAAAQTLTVSISGTLSGCENGEDNGSFESSFTFTAGSGSVRVNFGGDLGSIPIDVASFDALIAAIADAGGSLVIPITGADLGSSSACIFDGTISYVLEGRAVGPDAPGNLTTTTAVIDTFVRSSLPAISNRIRALFSGKGTGVLASANGLTLSGLAAGDGGVPFGAWAGYSYTDSENDFVTTAFTSTRHDVLLGLDTMPAEHWVVGVSVALEKTRVNTRFNGGEQDITGISFTPYAGYLLSDWLSLDAAVGVSSVSTDQFRTASGARISSDVDSIRIFGNVNATGTWTLGQVLASARAGMLYATQDDDAFSESNGVRFAGARSTVGRFLLGGELAYTAGAWEPYVGATFEYDVTRTRATFAPGVAAPRADDTDVLLGIGLRYFGSGDLSGSIEYGRLLGRRNLDEETLSASVRWQY